MTMTPLIVIERGIPVPGPVGLISCSGTRVTQALRLVAIMDGEPKLKALDQATGETIFEFELPAIPYGSPITSMIDGRQYISIASGGGGDASLVTLSLV